MRFLASIFITILTCTTVANAQSNNPESPPPPRQAISGFGQFKTLLPEIAGTMATQAMLRAFMQTT